MSKLFDKAADKLEGICAHPLGFVVFVAWCIGAPVFNVDVANYVISVLTAGLLFLTLGSSRRDRLAVHIKLDDLERAVDEADDNLQGIEQRTEREIKDVKEPTT